MGNFLDSIELSDLIETVQTGRESSMQAEYLALYNSSHREQVKQVCEVLPHIGIPILPEALIIEPINLSDLSRLVVASEDCDSVLEAHFIAD